MDISLVLLGALTAYATFFLPLGVLLLKAKGWSGLAFVFVPSIGTLIGVITMLRLAKPHSWWAQRYYGALKMREARRRFPNAPIVPETALAGVARFLLVFLGPGLLLLWVLALLLV